eukprot:977796-Amphidinium_carterae.1
MGECVAHLGPCCELGGAMLAQHPASSKCRPKYAIIDDVLLPSLVLAPRVFPSPSVSTLIRDCESCCSENTLSNSGCETKYLTSQLALARVTVLSAYVSYVLTNVLQHS